jgi:zinc transporter 2
LQTQRRLLLALVVACVFMVVEVVGGVVAHSLAIITDAAHLLSDVSGFAISLAAAYAASTASLSHFSYGYHRLEVLGALASVASVWLVTGILLWEAVQRVQRPEPVDGKRAPLFAPASGCPAPATSACYAAVCTLPVRVCVRVWGS